MSSSETQEYDFNRDYRKEFHLKQIETKAQEILDSLDSNRIQKAFDEDHEMTDDYTIPIFKKNVDKIRSIMEKYNIKDYEIGNTIETKNYDINYFASHIKIDTRLVIYQDRYPVVVFLRSHDGYYGFHNYSTLRISREDIHPNKMVQCFVIVNDDFPSSQRAQLVEDLNELYHSIVYYVFRASNLTPQNFNMFKDYEMFVYEDNA